MKNNQNDLVSGEDAKKILRKHEENLKNSGFDPEKNETKNKVDLINRAMTAGVLLDLLRKECKVEYDQEFWKQLVQKYNDLQKKSQQYKLEFIEQKEEVVEDSA